MNINKFLLGSAVILTLWGGAAKGATFAIPAAADINGQSAEGFTFHGWWASDGYDAINAPFMQYAGSAHSITYDAGTFTFENMTLSGWPWSKGCCGEELSFAFIDASGSTIATGQQRLGYNTAFVTYIQEVPGVHEIYFYPAGGMWPRLQSINTFHAPDGGGTMLLLAGVFLALLGITLLHRPQATHAKYL